MLPPAQVASEIEAYNFRLLQITDAYGRGKRSELVPFIQKDSDALVCLRDEAPIEYRGSVGELIDRYEALRKCCIG